MKSIFTYSFLCSAFLLSSCTTTVVSSGRTNELDSKIKEGNTYTFKNLNGSQAKFKVSTIDETHISGNGSDLKSYSLEKNQISEVKKSNTLGTVLIATGAVAALIIVRAYIKNEPVGGR